MHVQYRKKKDDLILYFLNALSVNFTKWSNTLKKFVGKLPTNCFTMFDYFVELTLKGLKY